MVDIIPSQPVQAEEIDTNEVLRELGLDDMQDGGTVIQNGNSTITIPASSPNTRIDTAPRPTLEPPPVESIEEEPPMEFEEDSHEDRDLDAEEDEDWTTLINEGVISEVTPENNNSDNDASVVEDILSSTNPAVVEARNALNAAIEEEFNNNQTPVPQPPKNKVETDEALKYLIPINTKAVEVDETTSRFSGAAWYEAIQKSTVILAGLGGIGSWTNLILSRMKPAQLFLYDDDTVERANLSGQLYSTAMVGSKKVNAMAQLAKDFSEYNGIFAVPTKFTQDTAAGDIMICGFDNMPARKVFFNAWLNHVIRHKNPEKCLFIDGRLNMEEFQVFCMRGDDSFNIKKYADEYLFEDWQAESIACSVKQTTYCSNMIGSVIVNLFTNFVSNTLQPVIERDLPFKTYYDASMMYFKTEV